MRSKAAVLAATTGSVAVVFVFALKAIEKHVPAFIVEYAWIIGATLGLVVYLLDAIIFYPLFRSPLRHLPRIKVSLSRRS